MKGGEVKERKLFNHLFYNLLFLSTALYYNYNDSLQIKEGVLKKKRKLQFVLNVIIQN